MTQPQKFSHKFQQDIATVKVSTTNDLYLLHADSIQSLTNVKC